MKSPLWIGKCQPAGTYPELEVAEAYSPGS